MARNSTDARRPKKKGVIFFQCKKCGAIFDSQLALREHEEEIHFYFENEHDFAWHI